MLSLVAGAANAQLAASLSVASDYRYRGGSIGSAQPALGANLAYDASDGGGVDGYVGGALAVGHLPDAGLQIINHTEYVGMAGHAFRDATWDVGLSNSFQSFYNKSVYRAFNTEFYAGMKGRIFSYYLRYSPHYFLNGVSSLYADVDASIRPTERLRLFAHVGVLTPIVHDVWYYPRREQYDARLGVAAIFTRAEIAVAWTFQRPGYVVQGQDGSEPDAIIVTATSFF